MQAPLRWDDNLTDPHLNIVKSLSKRIAILAGPGTGKTSHGLLRRIVRLLQDDGVLPEKILFLTFSRTSAEDFRDKLDEWGVENSQKLEASTIHSFCLRVLKDEQVLRSTGRNANRILMKFEEDVMLKDLPDSFGNLMDKRKMLEKFYSAWAENADDYPGTPANETEKEFQGLIMNWLKTHSALLIGEVVPLAYTYLASNPTSEFLQKYTHLVIDEYQDLNKVEQEIIELLVGKNGEICIAGDDDQSIYGFRYANPAGIIKFFEGADEKFTIETSKRCPKLILDIANKTKEFLPKSKKGPLKCEVADFLGSVSLIQWSDHSEEASGIATSIKRRVDSGVNEQGDFLVLVQSKILGVGIRNAIKEQGIECYSYFQEDPIGNIKSKRAFTLLQLLVNQNDPVAMRYWLGLGDSNAKREQYALLQQEAQNRKTTIISLLDEMSAGINVNSGFRSFINKYKELKEIAENLEKKEVAEVIDSIFPDSDPDLLDLRQIAQMGLPTSKTIEDLLEFMIRIITQPDIPESPEFVRVMSLHKSKGLTSKVVYIASLVEGIAPKASAYLDEEEMNECRRLFYVAVTRAKAELVLSNFSSMPASLALQLQLKIGKYLRPVDGVKYIRTITSRFVQDILSVAPKFTTGIDWLNQLNSSKPEE